MVKKLTARVRRWDAPREGKTLSVQAPDRHPGHPRPSGSSETADAFGARVSLPLEGRSLFFVVGHDGPPDAAVQRAGGVIVARLADPRHALAIAPLTAHAALRGDRGINTAGPVSIDPVRFGWFAQLIGLDTERQP